MPEVTKKRVKAFIGLTVLAADAPNPEFFAGFSYSDLPPAGLLAVEEAWSLPIIVQAYNQIESTMSTPLKELGYEAAVLQGEDPARLARVREFFKARAGK